MTPSPGNTPTASSDQQHQAPPLRPTDDPSAASQVDGDREAKKLEEIKNIDAERDGSFQKVVAVISAMEEKRIYKGDLMWINRGLAMLTNIYSKACEDLARERDRTISVLEECAVLKAQLESLESRKTHWADLVDTPTASSRPEIDLTLESTYPGNTQPARPVTLPVPTRRTRTLEGRAVETGPRRPPPPPQSSITRRRSPAIGAGKATAAAGAWRVVQGRKQQGIAKAKAKAQPRQAAPTAKVEKLCMVINKTDLIGGQPPSRWPTPSDETFNFIQKAFEKEATKGTGPRWKIKGTWKIRTGVAIEVDDLWTQQQILRAAEASKTITAAPLPSKQTDLRLRDVPSHYSESQILTELKERNGMGDNWQVLKLTRVNTTSQTRHVIVRGDEEDVNKLLGGKKEAQLFLGLGRIKVYRHNFVRVCYTCGHRHPPTDSCNEHPPRCVWCGSSDHQMKECSKSKDDTSRQCCYCGAHGHGAIEFSRCDQLRRQGVRAQ